MPDMPQPSVGRIVHYHFVNDEPYPLETRGQSSPVPATVVSVFSPTCVNLRIHPDGPGPDLWETSVPHKDDAPEGEAYWEWPSRV